MGRITAIRGRRCQAIRRPVSIQWRDSHFISVFVTDSVLPDHPHIAVVRFSALGDVVMAGAAVRALRRSLPEATITWITSPQAYSLMGGMEGVGFEVVDKPETLADYRAFYRRFGSRHFDVVLAMQASLRINLLYPALHAPVKVGFDRIRAREGQWLFCNRRIPYADQHLVDSFLAFVETATGRPAEAVWELPVTGEQLQWAREQMHPLPRPWVGIHPHASKAERNWLPERYAEVVIQLVARRQCGILLTGGNAPEELALCERLSGLVPGHALNLCGKTSPGQLAALLSLADVLVAPDTGAVHIARAVGTPAVGLYAVAPSGLTGPYRQTEFCVDRYPQAVRQLLGKDPVQLPWNTRVHHPDAMALITTGDVMQQLDKVLEQAG